MNENFLFDSSLQIQQWIDSTDLTRRTDKNDHDHEKSLDDKGKFIYFNMSFVI